MSSISRFSIKTAAAAMALGLASGTALASGPVTVTPDPYVAPPPAPVFDWAGAYGGLSYSAISGRVTRAPGGTPDMDTANGLGAFVGYNWQRGNVVFGPELSYMDFNSGFGALFPSNRQRNALELRARAGYAVNNVLVYGFVGATQSEFFGFAQWNTEYGVSYGLGVQAHLGRNMFVGLEAARRDVGFTNGGIPVDNEIDTVTLRFGYQF